MKNIATPILLGASLVTATLFAGNAAAQDADQIETLFRDGLIIEVEPLIIPAGDEILTAPVFDLRYAVLADPDDPDPFRGASSGEHRAWVKDGALVPVYGLDYLNTDDSLDELDGLIDPAFVLDAESAEDFLLALKAIMGEDGFEPVPVDTIQNDGNTWYFVNGDFLSYWKGFVVTVDDDGSITDIDFELSMLDQDG